MMELDSASASTFALAWERWLAYRQASPRPPRLSTLADYRSAYRRHLGPRLGAVPLAEIDGPAIADLVVALGAEPISRKRLSNVLVLLRALTWDDVDLEARLIAVNKTRYRQHVQPGTKNGQDRAAPVPAHLAALLAAHRAAHGAARARGLVFTGVRGSAIDADDSRRRVFAPALARAERRECPLKRDPPAGGASGGRSLPRREGQGRRGGVAGGEGGASHKIIIPPSRVSPVRRVWTWSRRDVEEMCAPRCYW